jgi:hypothetical protein
VEVDPKEVVELAAKKKKVKGKAPKKGMNPVVTGKKKGK